MLVAFCARGRTRNGSPRLLEMCGVVLKDQKATLARSHSCTCTTSMAKACGFRSYQSHYTQVSYTAPRIAFGSPSMYKVKDMCSLHRQAPCKGSRMIRIIRYSYVWHVIADDRRQSWKGKAGKASWKGCIRHCKVHAKDRNM